MPVICIFGLQPTFFWFVWCFYRILRPKIHPIRIRENWAKNLYFTHFAYFRDFFTTFMRKFPGNDSIRERIRYKINYRKIFNTVFKVTTFIKKLPKSEILGIFFCEKKMKIFIFTGFDLPGPNFHCRIR